VNGLQVVRQTLRGGCGAMEAPWKHFLKEVPKRSAVTGSAEHTEAFVIVVKGLIFEEQFYRRQNVRGGLQSWCSPN
jgi:hypothetical protein